MLEGLNIAAEKLGILSIHRDYLGILSIHRDYLGILSIHSDYLSIGIVEILHIVHLYGYNPHRHHCAIGVNTR